MLYLFAFVLIFTELSANENLFLSFFKFGSSTKKQISYSGCYIPKTNSNSLASITAIANGSWQNTSTWSIGVLPTSADNITIPQGITVNLVGIAKAKTITV